MNGPHDIGGAHGFGTLPLEDNEPLFHAEWERRALAVTLAIGATGSWNLDMSRHARERIPPADYYSSSYYRIWFEGLVRLLEENGLATHDEIASGRIQQPPAPVKRVLQAGDVAKVLACGGPVARDTQTTPAFAVGDRVRARVMNPHGHTRLPRYVRGHPGTIERIHGCHVFPDTNAALEGECPHWLYGVVFDAGEVWGEANAGDSLHLDLWEPYLSAPDDAHDKLLQSPGIPLNEDGPVFAEPWEAKAFALAVTCHEHGLFTWHDWTQALGRTIAAHPDIPYYRQWLATLEGLLAEIGTIPQAERLDRVDAWDRAAKATPHGEPIVLGRDRKSHD